METLMERIAAVMREAGEIILSARHIGETVHEKQGHANFVTEYDRRVQLFLQERLAGILPEAVFVGEEEDVHPGINSGYAWIVDPIDGTTNFMRGYRTSAVSVALLKDAVPLAGLVYNPFSGELFSAEKGKGACLNGSPIHVSGRTLENGLVIFGTAPYYQELEDDTFALMRSYYRRCLDIRRSGSAALDLCNVACGRAELFFELRLSPWDYAAGALIVEEAGGIVRTIDGEALVYDRPIPVRATGCAGGEI